jgi:hypothetical protein
MAGRAPLQRKAKPSGGVKRPPDGTGHSPKSILLLRSGTGLAIEVKHDKGDSEQRLENPLQHI